MPISAPSWMWAAFAGPLWGWGSSDRAVPSPQTRCQCVPNTTTALHPVPCPSSSHGACQSLTLTCGWPLLPWGLAPFPGRR